MPSRRFVLGFWVVLELASGWASVSSAGATDATSDGAHALLDTLQRFVGRSAGDMGLLAVVPDGDAYRVTVDLGKVASKVAQGRLTLDGANLSIRVAQQADGRWRVSDMAWPAQVVVLIRNQAPVTYRFEGVTFEGMFDPALGTFAQAKTATALSSSTQPPPVSVQSAVRDTVVEQQATAAPGGGVDGTARETVGLIENRFRMDPAATPGVPAFDAAVAADSGNLDVVFKGARIRPILDLWAMVVAHPSRVDLATVQADVKLALAAALPLFDSIDESGSVKAISVETTFGRFALAEVSARIAATGAVPVGRYGVGLHLAGLQVPATLLKPWQVPLVPSSLDLQISLQGLNLEAGAKAAIAALDLGRAPPLTDSDGDAILAAVVSGDAVTVHIDPSRIVADAVQLDIAGDATITDPRSAHVTLTAKGLDAALEALKSVAATDTNANVAYATLFGLRRLGKTASNGATEWDLDLTPGGKLTVNGTPLGAP